jgi:hypothetical protein
MVISGCGRYRAPLTPEELAPSAVKNLIVTTTAQAVVFNWRASEVDRRGKELKSTEGFSIERKELQRRGDETDPSVDFDRLGFVGDDHVEVRDRLRVEARAAGRVGRSVKTPDEELKFTFTDVTPVLGRTYIYQIVPYNQGGIDGQVGELVKVVFQGAQSTVVVSPSEEILNSTAAALPVS